MKLVYHPLDSTDARIDLLPLMKRVRSPIGSFIEPLSLIIMLIARELPKALQQ